MSVTATCGHDVTLAFAAGDYCAAIVARRDRDGARVVSYETVCHECQRQIRDAGCLLESDEEANAYLSGTLHRNVW